MQRLIDVLSNGAQEQFDKFVGILRLCDSKLEKGASYEYLAQLLEKHGLQDDSPIWNNTLVNEVLEKGKVKSFKNYIARPKKLELLWSALRSVSSQRTHPLRVVVLHGMRGSGKSFLASEAVKCAPLLTDCFSSGVIWRSARHLRGLEEENLKREMKVLLTDILSDLGWKLPRKQQKPSAMTLDEFTAELVRMTIDKHLLIVLDDVWQQSVLDALKRVPVCILVTSRNKTIAEALAAHKEYVDAMKCTPQEAVDIVRSQCGSIDEETMEKVEKRCDGLPFAVSTMASILKDKSTHEQKEIFHTSDQAEWLTGTFKALSPEYVSFLDDLKASIDELKREIKERKTLGKLLMISGTELSDLYLDFAATDDGEQLFASKLQPVWNHSLELTQRLLEVLADRSLLTRTKKEGSDDEVKESKQASKHEESKGEEVFIIHGVHLGFLRELVQNQENWSLNGRYKRWIEGFLRKNKYSDLLVQWQDSKELNWMDELWHAIRASEHGSEQMNKYLKPLEKVRLPKFQSELVKLLRSK